jgi:hypothetical protein
MQTTGHQEKLERCRLGAAETVPFSCPEGCVFFEARATSIVGWQVPRSAGPGSAGGKPETG